MTTRNARVCLALLILVVSTAARAALSREELDLAAGGRVLAADTGRPGWICLGVAFPAGTAHAAVNPVLAALAPRVFLGSVLEGAPGREPLDAWLRARGWTRATSLEPDGASLCLAGPAAGHEDVLRHLLSRLQHPGRFDQAELDRAWREQEAEWERLAASPEVALRDAMARRHFGDHPYRWRQLQARPEDARPPAPADLRAWLDARYHAGAVLVLAAGDLDPEDFIRCWQVDLDRLPGGPSPPTAVPALIHPGAGRLEQRASGATPLMVLQYPGPRGDGPQAAACALTAGVISQLLREGFVAPGLAASAGAWYDYTSPGPQPLEVQVRGFAAADLALVSERVERVIDRVRKGEFSRYQVITAKDDIYERLDEGNWRGEGPAGGGRGDLLRWCQDLLRQQWQLPRWRDRFETRLLGTGSEQIAADAAQRLRRGAETLGLLLPGEGLDSDRSPAEGGKP
ncbi:MAG: insulinase family protein [Candidatus Krumholzibacteriota bacterium]|nr:insulinase family protein [Candidatus Krumholzibacteriota bacterium]